MGQGVGRENGNVELKEFIPGPLSRDRKGSLCRDQQRSRGQLGHPLRSSSRFYRQSCLASSNEGLSISNHTRPPGSPATADWGRWVQSDPGL